MSLKRISALIGALVISLSMSAAMLSVQASEVTADTTVEYKDDIVYVTGSFAKADSGKNVLFMIVPKATYTQPETAVYINEGVVKTDGTYTFKFKTGTVDLSADEYVFVMKLDGAEATVSAVAEKLDLDGIVEITPSIDDKGRVSLSFKNCYLDSVNDVKLVAAEYDTKGALVKAITVDADIAFGRQTQSAVFAETETLSTSNKIKVFMWDSFKELNPLTGVTEITQ